MLRMLMKEFFSEFLQISFQGSNFSFLFTPISLQSSLGTMNIKIKLTKLTKIKLILVCVFVFHGRQGRRRGLFCSYKEFSQIMCEKILKDSTLVILVGWLVIAYCFCPWWINGNNKWLALTDPSQNNKQKLFTNNSVKVYHADFSS